MLTGRFGLVQHGRLPDGHQLPLVMCLVECLLDRYGDPASVADAVAVLAGPLAYRLGLLPRLSCDAVGRTDFVGPVAVTFGFDSSGAFDEFGDGLVELLNVFARQIDFVLGPSTAKLNVRSASEPSMSSTNCRMTFCAMTTLSLQSTPLGMAR
jgi:hypothetical protein